MDGWMRAWERVWLTPCAAAVCRWCSRVRRTSSRTWVRVRGVPSSSTCTARRRRTHAPSASPRTEGGMMDDDDDDGWWWWMDDTWMMDGWYMDDRWGTYGWCLRDIWGTHEWYLDDVWVIFGWYLGDVWMIFEGHMDDIWVIFEWCKEWAGVRCDERDNDMREGRWRWCVRGGSVVLWRGMFNIAMTTVHILLFSFLPFTPASGWGWGTGGSTAYTHRRWTAPLSFSFFLSLFLSLSLSLYLSIYLACFLSFSLVLSILSFLFSFSLSVCLVGCLLCIHLNAQSCFIERIIVIVLSCLFYFIWFNRSFCRLFCLFLLVFTVIITEHEYTRIYSNNHLFIISRFFYFIFEK